MAGTESYVLDALNGFTSATYTNGDVVSYTYDAAGNLATAGVDSFTWDWKGRLASATVGGTTATYGYDGTDVRTSETVGGATTSYLWDRANSLPLLVDDGTNGYLHAGGLIAEITGGGTPTYHLTDALGSVRGLTDLAGTVTGTSNFDVFGDARTTTGVSSIFDFTGEQRDVTTGMVYLRARYYEPGYGRFVSEDTVVPGGPGTQGFNRFAYVGNNPSTATDPSGNFSRVCVRIVFLLVWQMYLETLKFRKQSIFGELSAGQYVARMGVLVFLLIWTIRLCIEMATQPKSGADGPNQNGPPGSGELPDSPNGYPPLPSPP